MRHVWYNINDLRLGNNLAYIFFSILIFHKYFNNSVTYKGLHIIEKIFSQTFCFSCGIKIHGEMVEKSQVIFKVLKKLVVPPH